MFVFHPEFEFSLVQFTVGHRKSRNTFGNLVELKSDLVLKLSEPLSAVLYMIWYFEGMKPYKENSKLVVSSRRESSILQIVCVLFDC